ncbi:helix-turn-helix domain-containing protein [Bradyrhizobium neotropicale]|nr:helix-turn-helix domain-containing protein [Bradyrhizobium neotropicale]
MMGTPFQYARNAEIYGEGDEAEYLYQVVSGTVRTYKVLEDGRRQIGGFYLPGDIFGFEAGETHSSSAEAVNGAQVLIVKRSAVMLRAEREKDLAQQLWDATTRELQRFRNHMLLLIKTAEERVAGFLLDIARRTASTTSIELAMSRQDIADYLGLTIETVSRTFTQLEQSGAITLATSRRIELRNRAALNRLNA